jgi:hypothetical protein
MPDARDAVAEWVEYQRQLGPLTEPPTEYDVVVSDAELEDES